MKNVILHFKVNTSLFNLSIEDIVIKNVYGRMVNTLWRAIREDIVP
jgi:hypothetical protein